MSRAEVVTDKIIRPEQLKEELGGKDVFTSESGIVQADGITQQQLEDAIAAHVPDENFGKDAEELKLEDYKAKAEAGTLTSSDITPALALFLKLRA